MKTKSLLLATALLMSTSALAQKNTFKGVVLDDQGEPVIGATVQVKGVKGAGAITDLDGNFVIDADANQTLVITYIGYKDAEIRPSANMKITLKQDDKALDEVVVVGYGVQKKSVVTAAIAKATESAKKNLIRVPVINGTIPHEQLAKFSGSFFFTQRIFGAVKPVKEIFAVYSDSLSLPITLFR